MRTRFALLLALISVLLSGLVRPSSAFVSGAFTDGWDGRHGHDDGWRERDRDDEEGREQEGWRRGYDWRWDQQAYYGPAVVQPAPYPYYAPPPVMYQPAPVYMPPVDNSH